LGEKTVLAKPGRESLYKGDSQCGAKRLQHPVYHT
jgi:hypothetical protein